ncbi:MAG TPA: M1 family aminopeptidase, partial [Chitinophagaceae bacterium]|nr:M1 family aminopeptidase [Chitinophagaceae bacterium]
FSVVSVVQGPESFGGGMEYPTITIISPMDNEKLLDYTIAHEIGHNWFYGILASNERKYPWMDEGFNTYYDNRYSQWKYNKGEMKIGSGTISMENAERILFETKAVTKKDQAINNTSEAFTHTNYGLIAYYKTGAWLEYAESLIGKETFDKAMQAYYKLWQFKHPQPQDFKQILEETSGKNLDSLFSLLDKKGLLPDQQKRKGITFSFAPTGNAIADRVNHPNQDAIILAPSLGFNSYDKLMVGGLITNYKLPPSRFQFLLTPMYAIGSKKLVGLGHLNYSFYTDKHVQKIQIGLGGLMFSKRASMDSMRKKVYEDFYRLTPSVKLTFKAKPRNTREQSLEAKSFIIGEKNFSGFAIKSTDSLNYVTASESTSYFINQVSFLETNFRKLYPYSYNIQLQQGKGFYRANFTGNYFFNYAKGGGMDVRFFAAKFGYFGNRKKYQLNTQRFQPKLLGITGEEDFTYSNYFIGRTASYGNDPEAVVKNRGIGGQQIMIRDGAFKLRVDPFDFLHGRSDNWVAALNFNTTLPKGILPFNFPLKVFLDVGTFAEAWERDALTSRFLYVSGLQLSLFNNFLNIYAPILYSKEFKDNLKTLPDQNTFFKRLTFSIDILNFDIRKINRALL